MQDQPASANIRALCDLGTEVAMAIGRRYGRQLVASSAAPAKGGSGGGAAVAAAALLQPGSMEPYPGSVVLPKSLYRTPTAGAGIHTHAMCLCCI